MLSPKFFILILLLHLMPQGWGMKRFKLVIFVSRGIAFDYMCCPLGLKSSKILLIILVINPKFSFHPPSLLIYQFQIFFFVCQDLITWYFKFEMMYKNNKILWLFIFSTLNIILIIYTIQLLNKRYVEFFTIDLISN